MPHNARLAVAGWFITQEEARAAVRTVQAAARAGHAYSAVTMFGFLVRKPAP